MPKSGPSSLERTMPGLGCRYQRSTRGPDRPRQPRGDPVSCVRCERAHPTRIPANPAGAPNNRRAGGINELIELMVPLPLE